MKTAKKSLVAALCVVFVLAVYLLVKHAPDVTVEESSIPYEALENSSSFETLEFIPYFTMEQSEETYPTAVLADDVEVEYTPPDPSVEIDRTVAVPPDHPEYLDADQSNPHLSAEGKVYANDRSYTITIEDRATGDEYAISFGCPLGSYNRFLYLNPSVLRNGTPENYYIWFEEPVGGGTVLNFNTASSSETPTSFTFHRALDQRSVAAYQNSKAPGAVWYTPAPVTRPVYINASVLNSSGRVVASIRLTVSKQESDGTYSIVDIDSNNLLTHNSNHTNYKEDELIYIISMVDDYLHDSDKVGMIASFPDDTVVPEKCIVRILESGSAFPYDEFISAPGGLRSTTVYEDSGMDVLAVTYSPTVLESHTLYFYILCPPSNGTNGMYQYIGRDYPYFSTQEDLEASGYRQG